MKKFLSYCIDYIWFSLFLASALLKLNFTLIPFIIALFFIPILFIPIDTLFLRLTRSGVGKSILCLYAFENQSISITKAFKAAFRQGIFNQLMLIFPISLFFYRWIKRLILSLSIKKGSLKERLLSLSTALMMILYAIFSKEMVVQKINSYFITHELNQPSPQADTSWIKQFDQDLGFEAYFPDQVKVEEIKIELPNSLRILNLKMHTSSKDSIRYQLTHTKLPSSWVKWSSKLVLNAALSALCEYEKGKIITRKNIRINKKHGVEFTVKQDQMIKKGRLILNKKILYRVEGAYASDLPIEKEQEEQISKFINLFSLHS